MKKKLKDLTYGEIIEICKNNKKNCLKCPMFIEFGIYKFCASFSPVELTKKHLDKEIEV